jgi:hypothetical protein
VSGAIILAKRQNIFTVQWIRSLYRSSLKFFRGLSLKTSAISLLRRADNQNCWIMAPCCNQSLPILTAPNSSVKTLLVSKADFFIFFFYFIIIFVVRRRSFSEGIVKYYLKTDANSKFISAFFPPLPADNHLCGNDDTTKKITRDTRVFAEYTRNKFIKNAILRSDHILKILKWCL